MSQDLLDNSEQSIFQSINILKDYQSEGQINKKLAYENARLKVKFGKPKTELPYKNQIIMIQLLGMAHTTRSPGTTGVCFSVVAINAKQRKPGYKKKHRG